MTVALLEVGGNLARPFDAEGLDSTKAKKLQLLRVGNPGGAILDHR